MTRAIRTASLALATALALSACETSEETGQLFGAIAGAGLGMALAGDDDDTMVAVAAIAGATAGAWIGGNIGRGLDESERGRLAQSTQHVLAADVPASSPLRSPSAAYTPVSSAPTAVWESPTNPGAVSGKTTLLQVTDAPNGGQCRTMRQSVTRNGQESFEDVRMCKTPGGAWEQA